MTVVWLLSNPARRGAEPFPRDAPSGSHYHISREILCNQQAYNCPSAGQCLRPVRFRGSAAAEDVPKLALGSP
jgi:hypothetical protein